MSRLKKYFAASVLLLGFTAASAQQIVPVIHVDHGPNSAGALKAHYVVLVSLDAFRWDYAKKYGASNLLAIGKSGAWAPNGMIPVYPSSTFPNHTSIITGLYPEHHGIVDNYFYDSAHKTTFNAFSSDSLDGSWYSGTPLWALAEKQGMRAACYFWPGCEAEIAGVRPSYYLQFGAPFDYAGSGRVENEKHIDQIIQWLQLPEAVRPHFITLYYPNADHQGHEHGPDSSEVRDAVKNLDQLMGDLAAKLKATHLPVDLIIVSDHGMIATKGDWVTLEKFVDLTHFVNVGTRLYPESEADAEQAYDQLKNASDTFVVYRRKDLPAALHSENNNPRLGDPVIVATGPYNIRAYGPQPGQPDHFAHIGSHGYLSPLVPEMKASFFATGPDIKPGVEVQPFENVNLYPLIAHILSLDAPQTDGNLNVLSGILRDNGGPAVETKSRTKKK